MLKYATCSFTHLNIHKTDFLQDKQKCKVCICVMSRLIWRTVNRVLNSFWNIYAEQKEKQGKSHSYHCGGFRRDHLSFLHCCFQNCESNCAKVTGEGPASDLVVLTFTYFPSPVPLFLLLTSSVFS